MLPARANQRGLFVAIILRVSSVKYYHTECRERQVLTVEVQSAKSVLQMEVSILLDTLLQITR